jgi:hypothetical protein
MHHQKEVLMRLALEVLTIAVQSGVMKLCVLLGITISGCCLNPPVNLNCKLSNTEWNSINAQSSARVWDELALHAIRSVLPQPTVHARNLYHLSVAMYDAWAAYDPNAKQIFNTEKQTMPASDAARSETIAFAAHRVLQKRYSSTKGLSDVLECFDEGLRRAAFDPNNTSTGGDTPSALGNRIGQAVLDATSNDGANEANNYADTSGFVPANSVLRPNIAGTTMTDPNQWQPLLLEQPFTQNGIPQSGPQKFVTPHWGQVKPFAMSTRSNNLYHDPGLAPLESSDEMRNTWLVDVLRKQSQLDVNDMTTIDASPAAIGNNTLATNDGNGHAKNPITNAAYPAQTVKRSDYYRVVAEFWADGPKSETPPGHWNVVANAVADSPNFVRKIGGVGNLLSKLEWDVKTYLALNGALHDAAITAWEIKRKTASARPISLVRYMATTDPRGLPIVPGLIELRDGKVMVRGWGQYSQTQNMDWQDPATWKPYQRFDFVTPAFPGFISGHSIFSRAAAEVLTNFTGSSYFPNGLLEVVVPANSLRIDTVPNSEVRLQWATYFDAADQAGQSRLWGGIHIEPDDLTGRKLGHDVGLDALAIAKNYFAGTSQ